MGISNIKGTLADDLKIIASSMDFDSWAKIKCINLSFGCITDKICAWI